MLLPYVLFVFLYAVCANGMTDLLDKCPVKETFLPDISRFYWTLSQSSALRLHCPGFTPGLYFKKGNIWLRFNIESSGQ